MDNKKALHTLEFDKIIEKLTERADSAPGKELCRQTLPIADLETIKARQEETAAAVSRICRGFGVSFKHLWNFTEQYKRLELGSSLSQTELLNFGKFLETVKKVKNSGKRDRAAAEDDAIQYLFDKLEPCTFVSSEISRCILSKDEIADEASPKLSSVRKNIRHSEDKIRAALSSLISGPMKAYLQDSVITTRGGRYCVPVRSDSKQMVPGMIHDQSSTGSTLFIEPMNIVKFNNEIRELEIEEKNEIAVILSSLSSFCFEHIEEIRTDQELMTTLDYIFAKARLALDMKAIAPDFNDSHIVDLKKARHPLIDPAKVVPINVSVGKGYTSLIITGPNTGGKTVTLKTVGLLTLMGQAGLHIPAGSGTSLGIFKRFFADIGDEQSIEQSLSTFSSHMRNIVSIVKRADSDSLVLFDELGAGTDPVEGAALAQSILAFLSKLEATVIATTHYSELKQYALKEPKVENACCEFDVATLRPTYRLLMGVAGKSNAFAISQKLGLPEYIITDAKDLIHTKDESFESMMEKLDVQRQKLEAQNEENAALKKELEQQKKTYEDLNQNLRTKKEAILADAKKEASDLIKETKELLDSVILRLQKAGKTATVKSLERDRTALREKMRTVTSDSDIRTEKKQSSGLKASDLSIGDTVKVLSMNVKGTVSTKPDSKGFLFVQMGIIRSKVHLSDLVLLDDETANNNKKTGLTGSGAIGYSKAQNTSGEIKLIGMTTFEAISELDKYLDDAYLAHISEVRIVHGKGTGALRNAVHDYLRKQKRIKEYHLAAYGEGDAGVTIAVFK